MLPSLFERLSEAVSGIWESVTGFFEVDEGERELHDEQISTEADISPEEFYDAVLVGLEDAREDAIEEEDVELEADIEEAIAELEEAPLFVEPEPFDRSDWPSWITDAEVEVMREEYGVGSYDDLHDFEKDEYLPGWRGFEDADHPAGEIDDMQSFRETVYDEFGLSEEHGLSDAELMTLLMVAGNQPAYQDALDSGMEPEEIAEEMEIEYRMTFESIDWFLGSTMWQFMLDRPDVYEIYINPETGEVDIYEIGDT